MVTTNPRHGRSGVAMDMRHWAYAGNGDYVSIAAAVPTAWERIYSGSHLTWLSGPYTIKRHSHSGSRRASYTVLRENEELPLAFYSRLKDAKDRAVTNAEGRDRMHVA